MCDLNKTELETKIAYLERHVEAQDLEIHKLHQKVDRQSARIDALAAAFKGLPQPGNLDDRHEKPPHY